MAEIHNVDLPVEKAATDLGLASQADADVLAKMGYKQELKRNFSIPEIFGIAFAIMGLLPSIASTLAYSIPAGPAGMVWGWFAASVFIFVIACAMAELGSAMPTSGGLYWWTNYYSHPRLKNPLCFLVGYSNTLGLIAGICSIDYGFALMFLSIISIARDGEWTASSGQVYAVFLCTVILHGVIASTCNKIMGKLQTVFIALNVILIVATVIALPIGRAGERNDAAYIFGNMQDGTTWPTGWTFMLSWLSPIWTIAAFDSCVHMSEEASNAVKAVPLGITMSVAAGGILGFIIMIVLAACMSQDTASILDSAYGQPMGQIYYDALGKSGAEGFMALTLLVQFVMGLAIVVATSRQAWAFSRDGALPFSKHLRVISERAGYIPLRMIWAIIAVCAVLGLLCLIDDAAADALFALAVAGNNSAYLIPIGARVIWGNEKFKPGPFYLGRMSKPIAWTAILFMVFAIFLACFPSGGPDPTADDMNYTVVIAVAVWGGAMLYYFISARHWFTGPQTTIGGDAAIQGISDDSSSTDGVPVESEKAAKA